MPEQPSASFADSCTIHDFDELLSLDDIFVEYFNEFLRLGTFVQKIEYNRELNTFIEKRHDNASNKNETNSLNGDETKPNDVDNRSIYSGFSDLVQLDDVPDGNDMNNAQKTKARQAQIMEWVKTERLSLFWRTELYRQYKLCKLLLRPLAHENEPSEYSSQGIGGYSRQSVYTAARTLSTENSNIQAAVQTATMEDEEQQDVDQNELGMNPNAIFENNIMISELLRMPKAFLRPGSRAYSVPANLVSSLSIFFPPIQTKQPVKMSKRSSSSKTSHRKSLPDNIENNSADDPNDPGDLSMHDSVKMKYFEDADNEEESNGIGDFGLEIQSSSNQLKYKYLGSIHGMQAFVRFLQTTNGGYDLYRFWMDCEFFKDTMAGLDQVENVVARTRLFRDLNDGKYHLPFMRHLQNKVRRAYSETSGILTHDVFLQVQYDVLRRLRVYWLARFIIHQLFERHHRHQDLELPLQLKRPADVCLYPIDQRARANLIEMTRVFLSDDYATNETILSNVNLEDSQTGIDNSYNSTFMRKYATIIRQDKQAGGLFLRHVTFSERRLLPLMLFCYDVDDFRFSNIEDKILESQHGLSILNTYFGNSAKLSLDHFMPDIQIKKWIETFHQYRFDKLTFEPLFKRALLILKDAWLRCIQEDVNRFTSAYYLVPSLQQSVDASEHEDESEDEDDDEDEEEAVRQVTKKSTSIKSPAKQQTPLSFTPHTEIQISNDTIYIKRPWVNRFVPSAATERQERLAEALENALTDEERQRLRAARLERLRKIEENRRKALKAAKERRQKEAEKKAEASSSEKNARRRETVMNIDRILPSKTATMSKEVQRLLMTDFQRYTKSSKTVPPKFEQKFNLALDIIKWLETTNPYEKQQQLDRMRKSYFDSQSKRTLLPVNEELTELLDMNNGRPDPGFIQAMYRHVRIELEAEFVHYCQSRIVEFEIDSINDFLSKSADELSLLFNEAADGKRPGRIEDDNGPSCDPDVEALASNTDGTGTAKKKHVYELSSLISDIASGHFNEHFYYFYAYLTHWVDQKKAQYIDQDLLFCIDATRLKEIANDALLQAKVRYILETYLEASQTSNSVVCRLDLTSTDLQTRMLRSLQRYLTTAVADFSPLEEAKTVLIKDKLVHYYAGYRAYSYRMNLTKTHPSRLARLQEQLVKYQQQQQQWQEQQATHRSAKNTARSSASTTNKNQAKKVGSPTSKSQPAAPVAPVDLTTVTRTQRILNERTKAFDTLPPNQVHDVPFPISNKVARQRSATNRKVRNVNNQEGQGTALEGASSGKDKNRGPVIIQYTLTSGVKVKCSDGKAFEEITNGPGTSAQQRNDSIAFSAGSAND